MTDLDLMLVFLLQVVVVLAACKLAGWLGQRLLGQSQVVMEMVTGVLLGPSVFGAVAPALQRQLFPQKMSVVADGVTTMIRHPSMQILYIVAQLGLVLYMFLVGLEFNVAMIGKKVGSAVAVSLAGIIVPFALGAILANTLLVGPIFFGPGINAATAALYAGAAMSITAFPMLARILYERGIAGTRMGTLALGAGATDDAVAWSLLAVVLAVAKGDPGIALRAILGGGVFALVTVLWGRRAFAGLARFEPGKGVTTNAFTWTLLLLAAGAYVTDALGIYAVFGAFLIGSAMPRGPFADDVRAKIEPLTVGLLLPFFFVFSGLNTQLGLVETPQLWLVSGAVLAAAILGKGLACTVAARMTGEAWRESWAIGTLMNARGLMELIILNIGLQQKVITPTTFAIFVIMAIVTTLMASPLFKWIVADRPLAIN